MAPRLKVFTWSNGFHAFTVAASSRPKALAAWDVSQDIFATGLAREIKSGPDHDAALKAPGQVIQRGEAIDAGQITKAARPKRSSGPSPAQKRRIQTLESELDALTAEQDQALGDLDAQIEALRETRVKTAAAFTDRLETAQSKLDKARAR